MPLDHDFHPVVTLSGDYAREDEKRYRLAARNHHATINRWRGRPKDSDSGEHHLPMIEAGTQGTDGRLPMRRNAPRGR